MKLQTVPPFPTILPANSFFSYSLQSPCCSISIPSKQSLHLNHLLQVLTTHVNRVQRNEAGAEQGSDSQDEEQWQIGKSNLDKWLQVLLQKDGDSAGSSPAHDSPLHNVFSPALSTARAATTGSVDLEVRHDQVGITMQYVTSQTALQI